MRELNVTKGTSKMYGVVRDKDGNPRVDGDPQKLDPGVIAMLSSAEREALGLWAGPLCRDAQGIKRMQESANETLVAIDSLVAASEIWVGDECFRLTQRADVPAGGTIKLKEA
jgi:hypothetical protein